MDACQTLSFPGSAPSLSCDLLSDEPSAVDGGASTVQRPAAELHPLPTSPTLKSHHLTPVPDNEASLLLSESSDCDIQERLGDFRASEPPGCVAGGTTSPSPPVTLRSCVRRCRPVRRLSDSAALGAISLCRRASEAPPPRPRQVHFPASPVTARLAAADPLRLLGSGDITAAYCAACERHGARPLPEVLRQLEDPASDVLRLSGAPLSLADVDSLEEVVRRRQWQRVDAGNCALRGETLAALLQIVTHYDAAPWLSLGGAGCERLGWAAVCGAVRGAGRQSALQWLSLDRTAPSEVAAAALGRSLRNSRLRVLHLERCRLHGRPLLTLLAAGLRAATGLRQLYLGDNDLGAGDGSLLGAALKQNTSLQLLDLRNNALDDDAAGYLLAGLTEQQPAAPNTGLLTLNLWHNRLTSDSATALVALLAAHPALETLNLGANPLGGSTAELLAEPLARPGPLRRLGLQQCRLGDEAASALSRALAAGSGLVRLDLRGNRLSVVGLRALLDGVEENEALRQLDLDPEPAPESVPCAVPESGSDPERLEEEGRDSPERADSGIDSPAKFRNTGGDGGSLEPELDGGALGTSADSTLGSSTDSDSPVFTAASPSLPDGGGSSAVSREDAELAGIDPDSNSAPDGEYRFLLSALVSVCDANRQRPAPEPAAPPPPPIPETEDEPPTGHWLRRRLSAALRRVSLTCETPPRLTAPAPAPAAAAAAQPVPVPEKPGHRRLISPSPSPSESPLPSPTSGRSRFKVIRVSSAVPPPGTPPLTRGLSRPARTPSPSPSREGSPGPAREDSCVASEEDVSGAMKRDSIVISRQRNRRLNGEGEDNVGPSEGDRVDSGAGSLGRSPCEGGRDQWQDESRLSTSDQWANGHQSPPGTDAWTRTPSQVTKVEWSPATSPGRSSSTLSPDSGLGEAGQWQGGDGGCESTGQNWRPAPRSSPRPAGRKFRVTPVRETLGPA